MSIRILSDQHGYHHVNTDTLRSTPLSSCQYRYPQIDNTAIIMSIQTPSDNRLSSCIRYPQIDTAIIMYHIHDDRRVISEYLYSDQHGYHHVNLILSDHTRLSSCQYRYSQIIHGYHHVNTDTLRSTRLHHVNTCTLRSTRLSAMSIQILSVSTRLSTC